MSNKEDFGKEDSGFDLELPKEEKAPEEVVEEEVVEEEVVEPKKGPVYGRKSNGSLFIENE